MTDIERSTNAGTGKIKRYKETSLSMIKTIVQFCTVFNTCTGRPFFKSFKNHASCNSLLVPCHGF